MQNKISSNFKRERRKKNISSNSIGEQNKKKTKLNINLPDSATLEDVLNLINLNKHIIVLLFLFEIFFISLLFSFHRKIIN